MRKLFVLILLMSMLMGVAAQAASVKKIEAYIKLLNKKLSVAKKRRNKSRIIKLKKLIKDAEIGLTKKIDEEASKERKEKPEWLDESKKLQSPASGDDFERFKKEVNEAITALSSKIKKSGEGATVHGRAYIHYQKDLMEGSTTPNNFDISRVYLDYKNKLDRDIDVRVTTDISRTLEVVNVYLKYAYFGINNFPLPHVDTLRIGQSPAHWIDFMQKYWKFRYVAKTMTDHYGYFNSADLGIALLGTLDDTPLLGDVTYHAIVMNGEGYKKAEVNSGKDVGITLKAKPLKDKLTVAAGFLAEDVSLTSFDLTGLAKKATAMLAYQINEPKKALAFIEYANQLESSEGGLSIGGQFEILDDTNIFARVDNFKKSGDDYVKNIVGLEYSWGKNLKLALDYQLENKNNAENSKKVAVHTRVKW